MKYTVISDTPFSLDGINTCDLKKGDVVDLLDGAHTQTLIRNGIIADFSAETTTVDTAETVVIEAPTQDTPIAIIEANSFDDKGKLKEYAEDEHGIQLKKNMTLDNMKIDFADQFVAKMEKIDQENKSLEGAPENKGE
jgi:hypothetical protein